MARLFIEGERIGEVIRLQNREVRYLVKVLRLEEGDEVEVFDGRGRRYRARLLSEDGLWYLEILEELEGEGEPALRVILGQGILKGEKMKWVIQKATELGASEIVPVVTQRSVPVLDEEAVDLKVHRWRKIAEEASRQCNRAHVPRVREPLYLPRFAEEAEGHKVALWERATLPLGEALPAKADAVTVLIGPEGGLSEEEAIVLEGKGFVLCSLGRRILRSETAALAVLSILQHLLGDLGR